MGIRKAFVTAGSTRPAAPFFLCIFPAARLKGSGAGGRCAWLLMESRGRSVLGKIANAPAGQAHMIGALQQETATPASPTRYTMSYN